MRTVYACVFEVKVPPSETPAQSFERLWTLSAQWVEGLYNQYWQTPCLVSLGGTPTAPLPHHSLQATREQTAGICELVSLDWSYPDQKDEGLRWAIALQLSRNGKQLEFALGVRILSTQPIVKPLNYTVERPGLIDLILTSFPCFVGKRPIPLKPRELESAEVQLFVEETLCAPDRWLPVILISPENAEREYLVDPADLQKLLLGHAQVVTLRDAQAGFELTRCLGKKELSCYLGAVRLYWPGFTLSAAPDSHPLYLAESIRWHADKQPLGPHLFRMLVGVANFRFTNAPIARLVRSFLDQEKHGRLQRLLANSKNPDETQEILKELERSWDEITHLRQERDEARAQVSELTRELESQKAAAGKTAPPTPVPEFASVIEAVNKAQKEFPATLLFLPSAINSASESPYQWPEKVYSLFGALDDLTHRWRQQGSIGSGWHHALKPKGFDYKEFISQTARGKFGEDYTFTYEGQPILFKHHVTLGAKSADTCISIHWHRDETRKLLVIGWCGRHLSNTQS